MTLGLSIEAFVSTASAEKKEKCFAVDSNRNFSRTSGEKVGTDQFPGLYCLWAGNRNPNSNAMWTWQEVQLSLHSL